LARWQLVADKGEFAFAPGLEMCFRTEEEAKETSDLLRKETEIETEVVRID